MGRTPTWGWLAVLALMHVVRTESVRAEAVVLDDFEELSGWTATASEGAHAWIVQEPGHTGMGVRLGFDLSGGGGYVILRKSFSLPLPENYAFSFHLRGDARPNNFEFKLVDAAGRNVWWRNQRDFVFPADWQCITIPKSRLAFAWGPSKGAGLKQVGAIEFAISAGEGGSGSVWIDDLTFEKREPTGHDGIAPDVQASTSLPGREPALMTDPDPASSWMSAAQPDEQWVTIDFHRNWEYGGLAIDWEGADYATAYEVQVSSDGSQWTTAFATRTGSGGRDYVYMPDAESRFIRLYLQRSSRRQGYGIRTLTVKPVEFSASRNQFFEAIARDGPAGLYPKYFQGRQTYWTVIGVDGDDKEALLNEEGMLEVDKGEFSIEPFVYVGGQLLTWDSVETTQELEDGYLPMPSVTWNHDRLRLHVSAFASGKSGASMLYARYRVENRGDGREPVRLFLAIRPFQVNPPWQSINMSGGAAHIQWLRFDGRVVWVNREKAVVSLTAPDHFGAGTFEQGSVTDFLHTGEVPSQLHVSDPFGFASGALGYDVPLDAKGHHEVDIAIPFHEPYVAPLIGLSAEDGRTFVAAEHEVARRYWLRVLNRVEIELPPEAQKITHALKTTVAYILINRDGPAIHAGPRNYARTWIRDGAITVSALLQMGFTEEAREFLRWYARFQAADGRVPCCVDRRGADPVSENDSAGEFVYGVWEYYRFTRDVGFLNDMWPHVVGAVDYLTALRNRRLTEEFTTPEKQVFYGLLPESISHEGYASHPVHSYWDDFFGLIGLKGAAAMAVVVGDAERAEKFAALRDAFRKTLYASITRTLANHGIDYIPGSVELGDFDPTSTAIALAPGDEREHLPEPALTRTFDRYWDEVEARRRGDGDWEAYSPYEVRNVEAFIRLGQRDRALALLDAMLADQRPAGWNGWGEIAWRDREAPRYIGDMPHTWVGAGFIRSVRGLFAYERESDQALVLAAGVRPEWVTSPQGVTVRRLPTYYGVLNYTLRADGPDAVRLQLSGDMTVPPGGMVVMSPLARPLRAVTVNGAAVDTPSSDGPTVRQFPAEVVLRYEPGAGTSDGQAVGGQR